MPDDLPRVLSDAEAARLGFTLGRTRTELRRDRWRRLGPGVLLTRPEAATRQDWMVAGMHFGGPGAVVSGWDVVRLRGFGAAEAPSEFVLVLTPGGRNRTVGGVHLRPSSRPVRGTRVSLLDTALGGVSLASTARAVCDTALLHDCLPPVRAMVTTAVQRGLCATDDLIEEWRAGPRNGSAHLHRALADVLDGARSIAEAEAADLLRAAGADGFIANAPIFDETGQCVFVADFVWPHLRAIVEIDSREYHFAEDDWQRTMRRHNKLTTLGYAVTHYPPSDVRRRRLGWAHEVRAWLAQLAGASRSA